MADLVPPDRRFHDSFLEALDEFGDVHLDGGGLDAAPDRARLGDADAFAAFVRHLRADALAETPRPEGWVPCTFLWIAEGDTFLGFLAIRHRLTEHLLEVGGHIGYSIRPSARRRGLAAQALHDALPVARDLGLDQVLLTCDEDNVGSRRTIEKNGGVYEDSRQGKRRYWIDLTRR